MAIEFIQRSLFKPRLRPMSLPPTSSLLIVIAGIFSAIGLGLLTPFLGISSWGGLAIVITALTLMAAALATFYSGARGRPWAIGFTFFLIALVMEATLRRRELTATSLDAQTLFKLLVWGAGLAVGFANYPYVKSALIRSVGLRWLLAFAVWALLSTTYSISPSYTFGGGFAMVAIILMTAAAVERGGSSGILKPIIYACGLLAVSAVVLYFVAPQIAVAQSEGGRIPRLAGLTGSPNNLGRVASLGLLFLFFAWQQKLIRVIRPDFAVIGIACIACLGLSWSRTSIAALVVSILVVKLRRQPWVVIAGAILFSGLLLLLLLFDFNWDYMVRLISRRGSIEELLTFTGRTAIWEFNWVKFLEQPVLGYGYGATKLLMPEGFRTAMGWTSTSAHNMMLQTLVTTGIIGAVLIIATLIWQLSTFVRKPNDLADAIFVYVVLSGLFEPGAVGVAPNMLTLVWIAALVIPRVSKTVIEKRQKITFESRF